MPDSAIALYSATGSAGHAFKAGRLPRWQTGIRLDVLLYALLLAACGGVFYLHWNMWEDQSAQVYMAWGMFHGMRPYVDLVDPNWPGVLLPHALAYLLSGTHAWGLRTVDLLFLLVLLSATSFVLEAWKTPRSLRMLAGIGFLLNYFGTGWWWTAQRESFAWPLFVVGAIPFLLELRPRMNAPSSPAESVPMGFRMWLVFGAVAGLSLWIKPVAWLALSLLFVLTPMLCDRGRRVEIIQKSVFFAAGAAVVSLLFIVVMEATGMLPGFIKWGILYDLGPYSQVKWPWTIRLWFTSEFLLTTNFMPLPLLLAVGGCVMTPMLRLSADRWRRYRRPLLTAAVLLLAGLMTALLQGKNHSLYHYIPMDWALAFFAATIWAVIPWKKAFADAATLLAIVAVLAMFIHEPSTAGPTAGEMAADRVRPRLSQNDQVVEWGYAPSLLASLQRRTPFQTFVGTSFLTTSPQNSWAAREVLDRLNTALQNPSVKYLFVDQIPCLVIQGTLPFPRDYLLQDAALRATIAREYRPLPEGTLNGFDVFEHVPRSAPRPITSG